MPCEFCSGTGRVPAKIKLNGKIYIVGSDPCPGCLGNGKASCCEGMVGGPQEATNGAKNK